jgi:excisionase family DNA binding protein
MSKVTHTIEREHLEEAAQKSQSELLTVSEIADRLRVDATTVRRWIKNDVLDAVTLPHRGKRCAYRIRQSVLDTLLTAIAS